MRPPRDPRATGRLRSAVVGLLVRVDPALLLIPLIGLIAVWPFLTQSLPSTDDGALHMRRLAEIDRCLRHGVLPLRWAPDFAHGYGYPFFNYYASLSSYVAEFWRLFGLSIPQAIAAATVMAIWASGWGTYLLGRAMYGSQGGLVAATAYMYAPYQFYDSAYRGNLAETWALALLPWMLWAGRRMVVRPGSWDSRRSPKSPWTAIVPLGFAYAGLIYTHNVYALISSPLLGLYLLALWWSEERSKPLVAAGKLRLGVKETSKGTLWKAWVRQLDVLALVRLAAGVCLGLALSAFFWLPAFGERGWTRFSTGLVDYRTFFLRASELLAPPPQVDLALLNYYPPRSLNWGMLALIGIGLVWLVGKVLRRVWVPALRRGEARRDSTERRVWIPALPETGFFLLALVGAAFLTVRASDPLWQTVPLLGYALIPWRFLGIASLAGSMVAGAAIASLVQQRTPRSFTLLGTCVAIALVIAAAVPWTYATPVRQRAEYGVADIIGWEYSSKLIGTTAKNEFLPIWSPRLPPEPADPALLTEADPIIERLDASYLPEGAQVVSARYGLMRADLVIDTPRAFRALYKQLYFPGWQVSVDGQRVAPVATVPYGLLGFEVPEGRHRVIVRPATTLLRLAGNAVSGLGSAVVVALGVLQVRQRSHDARLSLDRRSPGSTGPRKDLTWPQWLALATLAALLLVVKEGWIDHTENLFRARRFDPRRPSPVHAAQVETAVNFGDVLTLHGYRLPQQAVVSGQPVRVDLYLSARHPPGTRAGEGAYVAYARLVDDQGRLWSLPYNDAPEGHRPPPATTIWPTDAYGHWAYLAYTLPGTPPGTYSIQVGLFERDTWRGLNVLDDAGRIAGLSTRIGPLEVVRPRRSHDLEALEIERPAPVDVGPDLRYLGSTVDAPPRHAGDELGITLFWQAVGRPASDYRVRLAWHSGDRTLALGEDLPLGRHEHPTSEWPAGEIVRSPHRLRIPAGTPDGPYVVQATVTDRAGQPVAVPIPVAEGVLEPTDRQMTTPETMRRRVEASLGARVLLLGYDLSVSEGEVRLPPGESVSVTLYWQAQRGMAVSYKVFVQLVDAAGVLAQSDAVPANWQRPTTGWAPGEVVADEHTLTLLADAPPGDYALIAGMYDEGTLQRLAVLDASGTVFGDHVTLEGVVVE